MAGILPLDVSHATSKSKRLLDGDGSPEDDRRVRPAAAGKRARREEDYESIHPADLLADEVVDSGHHALMEKEKEKEKQKQLVAAGMAPPKTVQLPGMDMFASYEEPVLMHSSVLNTIEAPPRGWTEQVKEQKKTHFSAKETEILRNAIIDYCKRIGYKEENISEFLFSKKRDLNTGRDGIWPEIGTCLCRRRYCRSL